MKRRQPADGWQHKTYVFCVRGCAHDSRAEGGTNTKARPGSCANDAKLNTKMLPHGAKTPHLSQAVRSHHATSRGASKKLQDTRTGKMRKDGNGQNFSMLGHVYHLVSSSTCEEMSVLFVFVCGGGDGRARACVRVRGGEVSGREGESDGPPHVQAT